MEPKIIVIIAIVLISLVVVATTNRKKITKVIQQKKCEADDSSTNVIGFDSRGGNEAGLEIKEGYDNVRRNDNRVNVHLNPSITNRSTVCATDACTYCDPYNKQLVNICHRECKKESC